MKDTVKKVYTQMFKEDERLCGNNASSVEYLTNMKYISNELKKNDNILELGAATGRYTIPLAIQGYQITALEYVQENLDVLKGKLTGDMNVEAIQGDAKDLSRFSDNSFDVVLNMGPLYHFPDKSDREQVVSETMRVLKPGGTAFFAFISNDMVFVTESLMYSENFLSNDNNLYNKETHKISDDPFTVLTIDSIRELMLKFKCDEFKFIASDGYAELLADQINKLNEEQFELYMKYHYYMCEKKEILGASHHLLYITKKG